MKKLLLLLGLACLTFDLFAANYYIDWVAGNDSSSGQSKVAPWKRAPGMKGFTGSYSHVAGDTFIFKGGVTWPSSCYQWKITLHGSSTTVLDTYTADPTWYSGGSFTRPIFDFEHVAINGWTLGAGVLVEGSFFTKFDNLEFIRHRTPLATGGVGTWGCNTITFNGSLSGNLGVITNCVIRDWDQPSPMIDGTSGGGGVNRLGSGNVRVLNSTFHQDNVTQKNGTALWNVAEVGYCEIRNTPTAIMYSGWAAEGIHHNYIHDLPDPADNAAHSNAILVPGGRRIYNNLIHTTTARAQVIFINSGYYGVETAYIYNNVVYDVAQPSVATDTDGLNAAGSKTYVWNNSFEGPYNGTGVIVYSGIRNNGPIPHLEMRNNHFITSSNPILLLPGVTTLVHGNNLTNTQPVAEGLGYVRGNLLAPIDGSKPTVDAGYNLSAYFTDDYNLETRSLPWDIGAHEWAATTGAGSIVLSTSAQSISEEGGATITVTAYRTGGSTGIIGCSYAASDGTATSGVNYAPAASTLSWANGDVAAKSFSVTILDADMVDNKTFTVTISSPVGGASIGSPSTQTVTILGSAVASEDLLTGWSWPATNGVIALPFYSSTNVVVQAVQTLNPLDGGRASYTFTNSAGTYAVTLRLKAPSTASDSLFWNVNAEPTSPEMIFDIPGAPITNFTEVVLGRRGTGTWEVAEFPVYYVTLPAGTNTLIIRGRESGCEFDNVSIGLHASEIPPQIISCSSTTADGYYKASSNILLTVTWSTNVTVTGTPTLALNSGGSASYASGSGSDVLVFSYTVAAGENSADLDYTATNSLALNGGSIAEGANSAVLTLPAPGGGGSIASTKNIVVDTTAPTVSISGPIPSVTQYGPVTFNVRYDDTNWGTVAIDPEDVELLIEGWPGLLVGTVTVSGPENGPDQVIQLSNFTLPDSTGSGTVKIKIPAGEGLDLAANASPASSYSDPVTIRTTSQIRARVMRIESIVRPTP